MRAVSAPDLQRAAFPDYTLCCLFLGGGDQCGVTRHNPRTVFMINDHKRKEMGEKLSGQQNALLRTFIDHTPAPVAMFDTQMRYLAYSRRWVKDYNLGDRDITGLSHYEVFPGLPRKWKEIHQRCLAGATEKAEEDSFVRPDGKMEWLRWEIHPWYQDGDAIGGIIIFSEVITERKQAEQALQAYRDQLEDIVRRRTAALVSANLELEAFCHSVSHDLRTPLRSIGSFSQILLEDYAAVLDEQGHDHLNRVILANQRMEFLIDSLLRLSRITQQDLNPQTVDLSLLAHKTVAKLGESNPDRRVTVDIQPDLVISGDPQLFDIAIDNLIGNAWKYTSERPDAQITFGVSLRRGQRVFFVRDNGVGFDMQYYDKLFVPFQRLHTDAEFEGSGIGLSIVARIIQRHGGSIWARSEAGQGCTVCFTVDERSSG